MDFVSVIIPTFNRADWLCDALHTLATQRTNDFDYEVVIVDNRSTDNTREVVESLAETFPVQLTYAYEPNEGVAPARNHGVRVAAGNWLAFMDDDELAEPTWLMNLLSTAKRNDVQCVGGAVHLAILDQEVVQLGDRRRRALRERREDGAPPREMRRREFPGTDNLLCARKLFENVGCFDESMRSGGSDNDLTIRIRRAGNELWFSPNAVVRHRVGPERLTPQFFQRDAMQSGSLLAFFDHKYRGTATLLTTWAARTGQFLLLTVPKLLLARLTGNSQTACEQRIPFYRYIAYSRRTLSLIAPNRFPEDQFQEWLNFRNGRRLHQSIQEPIEVTS